MASRAFLLLITMLFTLGGCTPFGNNSVLDWNSDLTSTVNGTATMFSNGGLSSQSTCTSKNVVLYAITENGSINLSIPIKSVPIQNDGTFQLKNLRSLGVNPKSEKVTYLLRAEACGVVYSRPLTGTRDQDITFATTLLEKINSSESATMKKFNQLDSKDVDALIKSFSQMTANSVSQTYDSILANSEVKAYVQGLFNIDFDEVKDLTPPDIQTLSIPSSYAEMSQASFSVVASHWYKSFLYAYEWTLDGTAVSHSASYAFVPTKNYQGTHSLILKVGVDEGSGNVDLTKPAVTQNISVNVPNTFPAIVPSLTLASTTPTNSENVNLVLSTGSGSSNCATFSGLALTENVATAPLSPTDYNLLCTSPNTQNISYTVSPGDGLKTLRLWAIDSASNISSAPQTINILLDQTAPVLSFTDITQGIKGGSSLSLKYVISDATSGVDSALLYFAQDGTTFVQVGDIKGTSSYNWTAPFADTPAAKFKIVAIDKAGNSANLISSAFTIDSTPPTLTFTSPSANSFVNLAQVTSFAVSGTCSEEGQTISLSGAVNATTVCTSGLWNTLLDLSALAQGAFTVSITQSDTVGNSTSISRSFIKDTIAPVLAITTPATNGYINSANVAALTITGTCSENTQTITFSGAASGTATCFTGTFSKSLNFTAAPQGSVTLNATLNDAAGNSTSISRVLIKDTVPPILTLINTNSIDINNANYATFSLSGTCSENGQSVALSSGSMTGTATCSGGNWSASFDFTSAPQGAVVATASQTDLAGNSSSVNLNLNKNTTIPTLGITSPAANAYVNIANRSAFVINGVCSAIGEAIHITAPVNATAICAANGTWNTTLDLTSLAEGNFTMVFNHSDSSGNMANGTRIYKKDTIAPSLAIGSPVANSYINTSTVASFAVSGTCSENGQTVAITIGGDASSTASCLSGAWSANLDFTSAAEGTVSITVSHADAAANSVSSNRSFVKDTVAPLLTIASPADGAYINATNVSSFAVTGTCSENTKNVVITGNAFATVPCTSGAWNVNLNFSAASQGVVSISVAHTDAAGNSSTTTRSFIKDTVLPTLAITTPANNSYINIANVSNYYFAGTCSENGQSISITGAVTSSTVCTSGAWNKTLDLSGVGDGVIAITASHSDLAGNTVASFISLTKDTVLPNLTLTSLTGGQILAGGSLINITWSGSDNNNLPTTPVKIEYSTDSGVTWTSISNGVANTPSTYSWLTPAITSDNVRVRLTLKDVAGNSVISSSSSNLAINSTPPAITLTSLTGGQYLSGGTTQTISWTATGNYLGTTPIKIEYSADSGSTWNIVTAATANSGSSTWVIPAVDANTYRVRVTVVDQSGLSASSSSSANLTLDNTNPTLTLNAPAGGENIAGASSFYINWNASDTNMGSTPMKFEYSSDNGSTWNSIVSGIANGGNYNWTVPVINSTTVKIRATATDLSGRTKQVVSNVFTVDSTPPTTPTASLASSSPTNNTGISLNVTCIADYAKVLITESTITPTVSDSGWQICASTMSFTISSGDSVHTVKVWSKDLAGNISTSSSNVNVTLDQTAPVLSIATPSILAGNTTSSSAITLTELNAGATALTVEVYNGSTWSQVGTVTASAGNNSNQAYTLSNWIVPPVNTTSAKLRVSYTDTAGNFAQAASNNFTIDSTAPTISSFVLAGGSTTTALPSVTYALSASDNIALASFRCSESSNFADNGWLPFNANSSLVLSAINGQKTVYVWVKDTAGNVSASANANISLDFGTPPVVTISNPTSGQNYSTGSTVNIQWTCTGNNGLSATPISLYYGTDSSSSYTTIASNVSYTSGTTGSYSWTLPSSLTAFRVLVKCSSQAGVTSQVLSNIVNTTTWSIWAGDIGLPMDGVNSLNAVLTPNNITRYPFAVDKSGNTYISNNNIIRRVDALTGQIDLFAGNGGSCASNVNGQVATLSMAIPSYIIGTAGDGVNIYVVGCNTFYRLNTTTKVFTQLFNMSTTGLRFDSGFLTQNDWFVYTANSNIYRVNLLAGTPTPEKVYGNDGASASCGANAIDTPAVGAPLPGVSSNTATCSDSGEASMFANADATKITVARWGGFAPYPNVRQRIELDNGVWKVKSGDVDNENWEYCSYISGSSNLVACADRWIRKLYQIFNADTSLAGATITLANDDSAAVGMFRPGGNGQNYILHSSGKLILVSGSPYTSYSQIAGISLDQVGITSTNPKDSNFVSPNFIAYNGANNRLYVQSSVSTKAIDVSAASVPLNVTSGGSNISWNPARSLNFSLDGTKLLAPSTNTGMGATIYTGVLTGTISSANIVAPGNVNPTTSPFSDNQSVAGTRITCALTAQMLMHSDGTAIYMDSAGGAYIYRISGGTYYRIAGLATTGYRPADNGQLARSAQLSNVTAIQEIPSGPYQKDLLIFDGGYLRRISYYTESANPKIYDVVNLNTPGYLTSPTSVWYDFSTEQAGVLGSGKVYLANSSTVRRIQFDSTLSTYSVYNYPFEGTTLAGQVGISLTPAGLMVLQPSKSRVLRVDP